MHTCRRVVRSGQYQSQVFCIRRSRPPSPPSKPLVGDEEALFSVARLHARCSIAQHPGNRVWQAVGHGCKTLLIVPHILPEATGICDSAVDGGFRRQQAFPNIRALFGTKMLFWYRRHVVRFSTVAIYLSADPSSLLTLKAKSIVAYAISIKPCISRG